MYLCFVLESCLMFSKFREYNISHFIFLLVVCHQIDVSVLYTRIIAICEVVKAKGSLGQSTYLTQVCVCTYLIS